MCYGAYRDDVYTCLSIAWQVLFPDSAGRLQDHAVPEAFLLEDGYCFDYGIGLHVIEEDDVGSCLGRLDCLLRLCHLHLYLFGEAYPFPGSMNAIGYCSGHSEMVLFDEHGVVESQTMSVPSAHFYSLFLEISEAWKGLSRACDPDPGRSVLVGKLDKVGGCRGDS